MTAPTAAIANLSLVAELESRGIAHRLNYVGATAYEPNEKLSLGAAKRAIEKQKEDAGLFREITDFETPAERVARHRKANALRISRMAEHEEDNWRRGLARLDAFPTEEQRRLVDAWNKRQSPATGEYFLDFLHRP